MTGDLEFFGLPHLLQTLERATASGVLTLFYTNETVAGVIRMKKGKFENCKTERLQHKAAIYDLFEKPFPGKFAFVDHGPGEGPDADEPDTPLVGVLSLIMEGIRRYDEFQKTRAVVPDDAVLVAAATNAPHFEDEPDHELVESVWAGAASGKSPSQIESELTVDAYRTRRLLARWVEGRALSHSRDDNVTPISAPQQAT